MSTNITLLSHQEKHVEKIWNLLVKDQAFSFIDTSQTGLGKTITTLYLAKELQRKYGTKVMVVAPSDTSLNNNDGWLSNSKKYGVSIKVSTTYPALRGGKGKVSHPWLIVDPKDKKKWIASKEFEDLCQEGLFLIFDEFHHTKNASISHFACAALVKMAKKYRKVCRVALLSHTPGEKKEVYPQILRMSGLITSTKMFKYIPFVKEYKIDDYGLGELKKLCLKLSPDSKYEIEDMMRGMSKSKSQQVCKDLYDTHIRSIITFAMPKPENKEFQATLVNSFLETDEKSLLMVQQGIDILSGAVNWNAANQQVGDASQWSLENIGSGLKMVERGKLLSMARYINREVKKNPNKKFVISCGARGLEHHEILKKLIYRQSTPEDYQDIISELREKNSDWARLPKDMINYISGFINEKVGPKVLNGSIKKKDRVQIIKEFQEDSNKTWCLIISPGIGSESISLHDKHGKRPREMLISPDYFHSRLIQSAGRVNRTGMKSDAKVMIVYSKEANLETNILNSMVRKAKTARDLIAEGQDVIFPGEYPFEIEGKKDEDLEYRLNMMRGF